MRLRFNNIILIIYMSQHRGRSGTPQFYLLASIGTDKVVALLSGTLVDVAGYTNSAAVQAKNIDKN